MRGGDAGDNEAQCAEIALTPHNAANFCLCNPTTASVTFPLGPFSTFSLFFKASLSFLIPLDPFCAYSCNGMRLSRWHVTCHINEHCHMNASFSLNELR